MNSIGDWIKEAECPLKHEFAADHRNFTKGLVGLIEAVEKNEWAVAAAAAEVVNRENGPHVAFEEEILYPYVAETRGRSFVQSLYEEHRIVILAIRFLLEHPSGDGVTPEQRRQVIEGLQAGLGHAVACGSLLSYFVDLNEKQQEAFLAELHRCRREGKTLLELEHPTA